LPQPPLSSAGTKDNADIEKVIEAVSAGHHLRSKNSTFLRSAPSIHESISAFDIASMSAIATGRTELFQDVLRRTGNTVCGRHPIAVIMAALEAVAAGDSDSKEVDGVGAGSAVPKGKFSFVRYERSSDVVSLSDSSVSYVSAFAVL
jgi:predicted class III extradiol MEMO1 family dioxygenase